MLIRLKAKRNESMELDERKVRILKAIVSNYLETGEPVGSIHKRDFHAILLSRSYLFHEAHE